MGWWELMKNKNASIVMQLVSRLPIMASADSSAALSLGRLINALATNKVHRILTKALGLLSFGSYALPGAETEEHRSEPLQSTQTCMGKQTNQICNKKFKT
ncbi:hypothetical protein FRX31_021188 [Thalictrum thalictroides]|uniref:Uncharacterized protein n=1 Tax=Thalictrum thalictroides TaxID=46969 RepID=A0A7J6VWK0_THATH|nr:hypothetical protein FRX31_021188 [Thalictrum thalictroides]